MQKVIILLILATFAYQYSMAKSAFPEAFDYLYNIDPSILIMPRYALQGNFVGQVIDGYKAQTVVVTKLAGIALSNVQRDLKKYGYSLVVYDAYRPQKGVDHFVRWSKQQEDYKTKK